MTPCKFSLTPNCSFHIPKTKIRTTQYSELFPPSEYLDFRFFDSLDLMPNNFFFLFILAIFPSLQKLKRCGFFFLLFHIFFFFFFFGWILPVHFTCDDAADGQLMIIKTCHSNIPCSFIFKCFFCFFNK